MIHGAALNRCANVTSIATLVLLDAASLHSFPKTSFICVFSGMSKALTDIVRGPAASTLMPGDSHGMSGTGNYDDGRTIGNIMDSEVVKMTIDTVPHYVATVVVTTHKKFMALFITSIVLSVVYFYYRIQFLIAVEYETKDTGFFWESQTFDGYKENTPTYRYWNTFRVVLLIFYDIQCLTIDHVQQQGRFLPAFQSSCPVCCF